MARRSSSKDYDYEPRISIGLSEPLVNELDQRVDLIRRNYGIGTSRVDLIRSAVKVYVETFDKVQADNKPLTLTDIENAYERAFKAYWSER
ncbi:ribbon-helix-helix domain-containing protein [Pelagibius sp. Alg239-R121]|uniref:ribbon-helix-helix domain-containing protein n=1 Tax=Pelagibius sp. Alg239-R121 TaxID=2993448 RepID=UPI0024A63D84|nr:ribbon-helix-helix domain-containing protein [Pelagibius sp. Alg239-R121]